MSDHVVNICRSTLSELNLSDIKLALKAIGRDRPERVDELRPIEHTPTEREKGINEIKRLLEVLRSHIIDRVNSQLSPSSLHHRHRELAKVQNSLDIDQATESIARVFE